MRRTFGTGSEAGTEGSAEFLGVLEALGLLSGSEQFLEGSNPPESQEGSRKQHRQPGFSLDSTFKPNPTLRLFHIRFFCTQTGKPHKNTVEAGLNLG